VAASEVEARVMEALRHWNPELRDLVDLEGESTELRGKVRFAKLPALDGVPFRTTDSGESVFGREVPVVVSERDVRRLTRWFVYADGTSRIGPDGKLVELAAAIDSVSAGIVDTRIRDGAWVHIDGLGRARFSRGHWFAKPQARVAEQKDHLAILRGDAGAVARCRECMQDHERAPSGASLERLREAYLAVPEHLRMYCGTMDTKDFAIRAALGWTSKRSDR
jgi:hypothetical protein